MSLRLCTCLVALGVLMMVPSTCLAQDTTAIKGLAKRDSLDALTTYSASKNPGGRAASQRIIARTDSIYKAMRKPKDTVVTPPPVVVDTTTGVRLTSTQNIQSAVNTNLPGTIFRLSAGTYARASVLPKTGNQFICDSGAIFDGQNVTVNAFYVLTSSPVPNDVTIKGCIIQNYATPVQAGAVQAAFSDGSVGGLRWLVRDTEIRYNAGIGLRVSSYLKSIHNNIHHNHQLGIGGIGDSVVVDSTEVAFNNYLHEYSFGWEAGGSKFVNTKNLVVRRSNFHDNWGPGIWSDINNLNVLYENNTVTDNADAGIFHEISYSGIIRNNTITGNGAQAPSGWIWGAGIQIAASGGTSLEIYGNTLSGNKNGISLIQQNRPEIPSPLGEHLVQNVYVHDNIVSLGAGGNGAVQDVGNSLIFTSRNNRFVHNTYTAGSLGSPFVWANAFRTWDSWKLQGQDTTGTFNP